MNQKTTISAKILADSKNTFGERITTMVVTFPRFILAELNTHRMFSRNSASSRAIPFEKMLASVQNDPFIPIAWQKHHSGMQGTEYLSKTDEYNLSSFISTCIDTLNTKNKDSKEYLIEERRVEEKVNLINNLLKDYKYEIKTLDEWWLFARDKAIEAASILYVFDVTKQLCNRLLEPFMWHTVIITATEWENFFALRCPQYIIKDSSNNIINDKTVFRSRKDVITHCPDSAYHTLNDLEWLMMNKGQAEIHMMALAEAMWDAYNESQPKQLQPDEWHIPFGDNIDVNILNIQRNLGYKYSLEELKIRIAVARCARVSYTVVGEEGKAPNYEKDIELHDRLSQSGHWSTFEHCAKAMNDVEYYTSVNIPDSEHEYTIMNGGVIVHDRFILNNYLGWSGNFKGFIQYRKMFNNENIK